MKVKILLIFLISLVNISRVTAGELPVTPSVVQQLITATKPIPLVVDYGASPMNLWYGSEGFFTFPPTQPLNKTLYQGLICDQYRIKIVMPVPNRLALQFTSPYPNAAISHQLLLARCLLANSSAKIPFLQMDMEGMLLILNNSSNWECIQQQFLDQKALAVWPDPNGSPEAKARAYIKLLDVAPAILVSNRQLQLTAPQNFALRTQFLNDLFAKKWEFINENSHLGCWDAAPFPQETFDTIIITRSSFLNWVFKNLLFTIIPYHSCNMPAFILTLQNFIHTNAYIHMFNHGHFDNNSLPGKSYFAISGQVNNKTPFKLLQLAYSPQSMLYATLDRGKLKFQIQLPEANPLPNFLTFMMYFDRTTTPYTYRPTNVFTCIVGQYGESFAINSMYPDVISADAGLLEGPAFIFPPRLSVKEVHQLLINDVGIDLLQAIIQMLKLSNSDLPPEISVILYIFTRNLKHTLSVRL
ncbi:MAG: hypothetical protein LBE97_00795 [Holosporales bacterium]|jgi:hypothetical protein|nr:hypothetical protein [Holosporales bacterium]